MKPHLRFTGALWSCSLGPRSTYGRTLLDAWRAFALLLALALPVPAIAFDPMSDDDLRWQFAYTALHLADYGQTGDIANHPGIRELNPLLGPHPSRARIRNYFAATLLAHWAVTYALPAEHRRKWQAATITLEAVVVSRNAYLGLRVRW